MKQAIFLCKSQASIHFFNPFNSQRYAPHNRNALRVYVTEEDAPVSFNTADLTFSRDPTTCGSIADAVASTGRFEDYTIEKTGLCRPWGPGIMYEIVFYFAHFVGFRDIHTIGWDVAGLAQDADVSRTHLAHFYDSPDEPHDLAPTGHEWRAGHVGVYRLKAYARHLLGQIYNRVPKIDAAKEAATIARSLPRFLEWLESQRTSVTIHTDLTGKVVHDAVRPHVVDLATLPTT